MSFAEILAGCHKKPACATGRIANDVVGNIMMVLSRERSDLIVISTHCLSGWRPFVFGSIAEKVIKLVECPLLLLRTPNAHA